MKYLPKCQGLVYTNIFFAEVKRLKWGFLEITTPDSEAPVLVIWGMWSIPSLSLLPDLQRSGY